MKTFKVPTIERVIWFSDGDRSHLLVKAKGRGWFVDTRNDRATKPPSKRAILACLTSPVESGFKLCSAKDWTL